jgi:hypothetical protein
MKAKKKSIIIGLQSPSFFSTSREKKSAIAYSQKTSAEKRLPV